MSKNRFRLSVVKYNALKLRANYQLPYYLTYLISQLSDKDSISYVKYLMNNCEHLLRTKGYYKKYPQLEKQANEELKKAVENRTYLNI